MGGIAERCEASFAELSEALDGVTEGEAKAYRVERWPGHKWHVGEDGSIAGLVWHVAAWKAVYLRGLRTGSFGDKDAVRPDETSWEGRRDWLFHTHAALVEAVRRLEAQGVERLTLDGNERTLEDVFCPEFTEHDRYHAAQVWYLRQRYRAEHGG